jgi:hypothetical protein
MEFVDPPEARQYDSKEKWKEIVKSLKERRGEWALVGNYSIGVAAHIRNGKYPAFLPKGTDGDLRRSYMDFHWEVTVRGSENGRNDVYIRWLG